MIRRSCCPTDAKSRDSWIRHLLSLQCSPGQSNYTCNVISQALEVNAITTKNGEYILKYVYSILHRSIYCQFSKNIYNTSCILSFFCSPTLVWTIATHVQLDWQVILELQAQRHAEVNTNYYIFPVKQYVLLTSLLQISLKNVKSCNINTIQSENYRDKKWNANSKISRCVLKYISVNLRKELNNTIAIKICIYKQKYESAIIYRISWK